MEVNIKIDHAENIVSNVLFDVKDLNLEVFEVASTMFIKGNQISNVLFVMKYLKEKEVCGIISILSLHEDIEEFRCTICDRELATK